MSTMNVPQVLKDCAQTLLQAILEFPFLIFTECDGTEVLMGLAGTFLRNPVESICGYFCFHCQAGRFDLVDSTAVMDVGYY